MARDGPDAIYVNGLSAVRGSVVPIDADLGVLPGRDAVASPDVNGVLSYNTQRTGRRKHRLASLAQPGTTFC